MAEPAWFGAANGGRVKLSRHEEIAHDKLKAELLALGREFVEVGPAPAISKRAGMLLRRIAARRAEKNGQLWLAAAAVWLAVGQPYEQCPLVERTLKEIELFAIEWHEYDRLARALYERAIFYCELADGLCDRYYEGAARLERWLADLVDSGRLSDKRSMLRAKAILCLQLALLRGDSQEVKRQYLGLGDLLTTSERLEWETYLEGVRIYASLGDTKKGEECLAALLARECPEPIPFNEMRRARAKAGLRVAEGEVEEALGVLEREYRPLCERYRNWSDVRFWNELSANRLPRIDLSGAAVVLFPRLMV